MQETKKNIAAVPYRDFLLKDLKNPITAIGYLNAVLEGGDMYAFLLALHDVAEAQGGIAKIARDAKLHRVTLHRITSKKGNPRLKNIFQILHSMGLKFLISREKESRLKRAA